MKNRIPKFVSDFSIEEAEVKYNLLYNQMITSENGRHYRFALEENNLAYKIAFSLYQKGISKELQLLRLEELMKKTELYLKKLNLDGMTA